MSWEFVRSRETSARTTGEFSSNYKGRVLPAFLSVVDDPTMKTFQGKTLMGSYEIDEEGVRVAPLPVIKNGMLVQLPAGTGADSRFSGFQRTRPRGARTSAFAEHRKPDVAVEATRFSRRTEEEAD